MSDDIDFSAALAEVEAVSNSVRPLLAGRGSAVQGAVLADLLATWLSGHFAENQEATAKLREKFLAMHIEAVRELVAANAEAKT